MEKDYNVSEMTWNYERNIYEMTVTPSFGKRRTIVGKNAKHKG